VRRNELAAAIELAQAQIEAIQRKLNEVQPISPEAMPAEAPEHSKPIGQLQYEQMRRDAKFGASPTRSESTAGRFRDVLGNPPAPDLNAVMHGQMTATQIAKLSQSEYEAARAAGKIK
jgi:hypothetical protein